MNFSDFSKQCRYRTWDAGGPGEDGVYICTHREYPGKLDMFAFCRAKKCPCRVQKGLYVDDKHPTAGTATNLNLIMEARHVH